MRALIAICWPFALPFFVAAIEALVEFRRALRSADQRNTHPNERQPHHPIERESSVGRGVHASEIVDGR